MNCKRMCVIFFHHSEKRVVEFNIVQMLYNDETKKN